MARPFFGRNPSRRPKGVRPLVEALEQRCVPSTTASSNGSGILRINTDSDAAVITVAENGPGGYTVSASDLTGPGISGGSASFSGITSIVVQAAGATSNDSVTFVGDSGGSEPIPATVLTNGLSVSGEGSLLVNIGPYFNVTGDSTFKTVGANGALNVTVCGAGATIGNVTVTGGAGNDSFTLTDGATVTGNLTTDLGDGTNYITLGNTGGSFCASGSPVAVTGSVNIYGGGGTDSVTFLSATINGNVTAAGSGNEYFTIGANRVSGSGGGTPAMPVNITGYLMINDPNASVVDASLADTTIGSGLSITSGAGNDYVNLNNVQVGGDVALSTGAGDDAVFIQSSNITGHLTASGTGNETYVIGGSAAEGVAVGTYLSINDPGAQSVSVYIDNAAVGKYLAVIGGAGSDTVDLYNSTVGQNLGFQLGGGNDYLNVDNVNVFGNLFTTGNDTGYEEIDLASVNVNGYVSLNDPNAAGLDVSVSHVAVGSYLAIIGGSGDDYALVNNVTVGQNFAVELAGGDNAMVVRQVNVAGDATLKTGGGNDALWLANDTFQGAVAIGTGGGNDQLSVQNTNGNQTQFFGAVTVAVGTGDAVVNLGQSGGGQAVFYDAGDSSFAGGGQGSDDVLHQNNVNYFTTQPAIAGFKTVTG